MPRNNAQNSRSPLERASWIAGITSAVLALGFGLYQMTQPTIGTSATVTGNSGPVVIAQSSPGATFIVNVPPPKQASDQDNCQDGERWVGAKPHTVSWTGEVPQEQLNKAKFFGRLRWSPTIAQKKATTTGFIELEVDGKASKIYEWSSPVAEIHDIDLPVSSMLSGSSGRFKIIWRYTGGSSGVCVAESRIGA